MEIAEHITALGQDAKALAKAAEQGGLDAEVPTCPGWDMRELVRHLGLIHLWAAGHVAQPQDPSWGDDLDRFTEVWPELAVFWPEDEKLISWYLETNANLIQTLESAPPDVDSFTFLPAPTPLAMWARRQSHETSVHRFDAENAAGIASSFDPILASDGVDELVAGFAPRKDELPLDGERTMLVHATDTDDSWHVTLAPTGITTVRSNETADVTVAGTASDLYLMMWNRGKDSSVAVAGDRTVLELWHDNVRIRWSGAGRSEEEDSEITSDSDD
ncbi:MAG: maleylpyruvate isomerase family mycothiol-dependent enzyme [Acidimicrobiia bacterium]|nr:maleylpyruvate isomerase family mycothiol-dependent enzyme [Acidimicrobiia bacterium]